MLNTRIIVLTTLAMVAFAGNSLLCRIALKHTNIDAASFTTTRLISGALSLWLITQVIRSTREGKGNWLSAIALFAYMAGFSFAYIDLSAATGALLLFGAVQVTMISQGILTGERLKKSQSIGFALALCGLACLLLPGISAPPLLGSILMLCAGVAWGIYSLRGKGAGDATMISTGNFLRAAPIALLLSLLLHHNISLDAYGLFYAVASGALTSGIGYAIWYTALPALKTTHAATVQLSVPVITAFGGIIFLSEPLTLRLILASIAILGGIALVFIENRAL